MIHSLRFPFTSMDSAQPDASLMPMLPLRLSRGGQQIEVPGLLDSGAAVNVLPYSRGEQLGLTWDALRTSVMLSGNLGRMSARGVVLSATVGSFAEVRLAFAWAESNEVPVILGQANFFLEFDICFYRSRAEFEVRPKRT